MCSENAQNYGEIYIIKNFTNGKKYIGQTIQSSQERYSQHIREAYAKGRKEYDYCLSRGIRKYGKEAFDFAVLAIVPINDLDLIEEHYIDMYNTTDPDFGYNMSIGHRDTANFKKYHDMRSNEEKEHFEEITDEDVERMLEEF